MTPEIYISDPAQVLLAAGRADVARALVEAKDRHAAGALGFLALAETDEHAEQVVAWLASAPEADHVVLVGIGGSALSARVFEALRPDPSVGPTLHVIDTVDPSVVERVARDVDPARALLIGVSKSGGTLETGAVFAVLESVFQAALGGDAAARVCVVAGEEENAFRSHAEAQDYAAFPIPAAVGGRYSGLTAVGLLPAALVGVEPLRLVEGARAAASVVTAEAAGNPAAALAALHLGAERAGRRVHVLWSYGERLRPLGPWWAQLAGESLGKHGADGPVGVTALAASGPADQHSLLQPVLGGPDDKLVVFVSAPGPDGPRVPQGGAVPEYAVGASLGEILSVECRSTSEALAELGRPYAHVSLPDARAGSVGAFMLLQEMTVALWGLALGIDPFDQPAVARGKALARARLERR